MNEGERDEIMVLARARRALSPTIADQHRVARVLETALAAPPAPAVTSWLLTTCAVAVVAAGSGYWLGHRAGAREARSDVASRTRPSQAAAAPSPPPVSPAASAPAPATEATAMAEATPALPPALSPPSPPRPAGVTPAARLARASTVAARTTALASSDSLKEELRALRGVERALRDRRPGLALALLSALDRAVPRGQLMEERAATTTIARCTSGDVPPGVDLGRAFAQHFPDSVYAGRVEQSCR